MFLLYIILHPTRLECYVFSGILSGPMHLQFVSEQTLNEGAVKGKEVGWPVLEDDYPCKGGWLVLEYSGEKCVLVLDKCEELQCSEMAG